MKIDVHCHTYPVEYVKEVEKLSGNEAEKVLFYAGIPIPHLGFSGKTSGQDG